MTERCCGLAPELILAIIDHLQNDKPSLNACSLVCKDWTHPARLHLFSSLELTLEWPLEPAVFPFVRHLKLVHGYNGPTWDQIIPLLVGFHRIISLEVHLMWDSLDVINPQLWSTLSKNFSTVRSLCLRHFDFIKASSVAQIFCAFPCLRELSLRDGSDIQMTPTQLTASTFQLPPALDTLELELGLAVMLEWFLSLPIRPAFRTVRLYHIVFTQLVTVRRFIEVHGNDLESLSLSADFNWTRHSIDITPITGLRSIEFMIDAKDDRSQWVTHTLLSISSASLEHVTFTLNGFLPDDTANALEWSSVDSALQHSTFSGLKNVYSSFQWSGYWPACTSIMQRLPQCAARGIVRVGPSRQH